MIRGSRVARRGPDLHRQRIASQTPRRRSREQVRLPGSRAEPEHGGQAGRAKLVVQRELLARHVEEPAQVDVVRARSQRAAHHVEVQPVVRRVHDDLGALQRARERRSLARVHVLVSLEPEVPPRHVRAPLLEERRDVPPDSPSCPDDGDHERIVSWRWQSAPRVSASWRPASSTSPAESPRRRSWWSARKAPGSLTSTARRTSTSPAASAVRTRATASRRRSPRCTSRSTAICTSASWSGCTSRTSRSAAGSPSCRRARGRTRRACS